MSLYLKPIKIKVLLAIITHYRSELILMIKQKKKLRSNIILSEMIHPHGDLLIIIYLILSLKIKQRRYQNLKRKIINTIEERTQTHGHLWPINKKLRLKRRKILLRKIIKLLTKFLLHLITKIKKKSKFRMKRRKKKFSGWSAHHLLRVVLNRKGMLVVQDRLDQIQFTMLGWDN